MKILITKTTIRKSNGDTKVEYPNALVSDVELYRKQIKNNNKDAITISLTYQTLEEDATKS